MNGNKISGAEAIIKSFLSEGVDTVFGYPGGAIIPVYDVLYSYKKELRHILVRHEQAAIHAAQGYARVTGRTGVAMVTSGPGATNIITGITDALIDSTPLVVITGQVGNSGLGTDAFQETDVIGITQPVTKWSCQVRRAEDIPEAIARAFHIASTGRPGPVVLDITKDAQVRTMEWHYEKCNFIRSYIPYPDISDEAVAQAAELINNAERPMIIAGHGVMISSAEKELAEMAEKADIPVVCTLLGLSSIPSSHPLYKGMAGMHGNIGPNVNTNKCDVLIAIGMRFDDRVTGDTSKYAPQAKIVHIDIDPTSIRKNVAVEVPVVGDCKQALAGIMEICEAKLSGKDWAAEHAEWVRAVAEWKESKPLSYQKNGNIKPQQVVEALRELTRGDAIIATEVGQHQMWAAQFYSFTKPRTLLTSGGLGTMGYGFPAAIGAQFALPDKMVIAVAGDASLQMNIQELATAVLEELPIINCIFNNTYLGMVRQWQKLFYGKRYSMTNLRSGALSRRTDGQEYPKYTPDFIKLAESYGAKGIRVTSREEIAAAFEEARTSTKVPTVIEFIIDPEEMVYPMVKPGGTLADLIMDC